MRNYPEFQAKAWSALVTVNFTFQQSTDLCTWNIAI